MRITGEPIRIFDFPKLDGNRWHSKTPTPRFIDPVTDMLDRLHHLPGRALRVAR